MIIESALNIAGNFLLAILPILGMYFAAWSLGFLLSDLGRKPGIGGFLANEEKKSE